MAVAVQCDLMSRSGDLGCDCGPTLNLLADQKKRRRGTSGAKQFEHRRSPLRVRPVVERQRNTRVVPDPQRNPERFRQGRNHRGRGGAAPRRGKAEATVDPRAHTTIVAQSRK